MVGNERLIFDHKSTPRRMCRPGQEAWTDREHTQRPRSTLRTDRWRISFLARSITVDGHHETLPVGDNTDFGGVEGGESYGEDETSLEEEAEGAWRGEDEVAYLLRKVKQGAKKSRRTEELMAEKQRKEEEEAATRERVLQAKLGAEREQRRQQAKTEERKRLEMLSNGVRPCNRPHTKSQAAEVRWEEGQAT